MRVIVDIVAVREQAEWKSSDGAAPGERRGKRHFRDCETACGAFKSSRALDNPAMLTAACSGCELRRGPSEEARLCMELSSLPDPAIPWGDLPGWAVKGIGFHRQMTRGF